ncbi:sensor histidine kinase [Aeromicrobium phragmitis]|uniref:sensor histidine kinase n=1 Tax=Aeromicrobium phragmitis TaxID=2478914 RepID=UPI0014075E5E|nr:histidine kinase [Aeromicrobium phragmitis]
MRRRLRDALAGPAADGARGPTKRDVALVVVLTVAAVLEAALRPDLAWPLATALVVIALVATLPGRRQRPLVVVSATTLLSAAFAIAQVLTGTPPNGLVTMFAVLLAPYALFRWGTGSDRFFGGGVLAAGLVLSVVLGGEGIEGAVAGVVLVGGAGLIGAFRRERSDSRTREIDAVRAAEREALARDLHDTVAHHVSAIAIRAQAAATRPHDASHVAASLGVIEREARAVLAEMRSLVRALRAPAGFAPSPGLPELTALAEPGPPRVRVRVDEPTSMPDIVASTFFRIAQEGVTNARRHARDVTTIDVTVVATADAAHLVVRDDGTGSRSTGGGGHGLRGVSERAALLGGEVAAGPDHDGGWTLSARIPTAGER